MQVYYRGLCKRYGILEDQVKEKCGKQAYTKSKGSSRKKRPKRFHDKSDDKHDALDELPLGEAYRTSHFLLIINSLISVILERAAAYSGFSQKFSFFLNLGLGEFFDDDLCPAAKKIWLKTTLRTWSLNWRWSHDSCYFPWLVLFLR